MSTLIEPIGVPATSPADGGTPTHLLSNLSLPRLLKDQNNEFIFSLIFTPESSAISEKALSPTNWYPASGWLGLKKTASFQKG